MFDPDPPDMAHAPAGPAVDEASVPVAERRLVNTPAQGVPQQFESDATLVHHWLDGKAENTRQAYRRDLEEFIDFVDLPIQAITYPNLVSFKEHLSSRTTRGHGPERELSKATIQRKLNAIKSLLTFAHEMGYTRFNAGRALKAPSVPSRRAGRIPSTEDVFRIFAAAESSRNLVIVRLFYGSALRRGDLATLTWADVTPRDDFSPARGQLTVVAKGDREQTILLSARTWQVLQAHRRRELAEGRGAEDDPVFWSAKGGALSGTQVYRIVRDIAHRAGLDGISPHALRHAHLSHALDRGATIEEARHTAGHASVETTGVYLHARPNSSTSDYLPE